MRWGRDIYGGTGACSLIAWALLVLMLVRATIPVGFMPDLDALRDGRIDIVVCTPSGLKTVTVSTDPEGAGVDEQKSPDERVTNDCPFNVVMAQALLGPTLYSHEARASGRPVIRRKPICRTKPNRVSGQRRAPMNERSCSLGTKKNPISADVSDAGTVSRPRYRLRQLSIDHPTPCRQRSVRSIRLPKPQEQKRAPAY